MESPGTGDRIARINLLLAIQSVVGLLVALNRKAGLTDGYVASNQFLRWVDLINLLILPVASLAGFVLLKQLFVRQASSRHHAAALLELLPWIELAFVLGAYVLGAGYGTHEVTNYLNGRYCQTGETDRLCRIIAFNDDEFGHWVFFTGFIVVNASLLAFQSLVPRGARLGGAQLGLLVLNGGIIAVGIFANLALEETGLDLPVVALMLVIAAALWRRLGTRPLYIHSVVAYGTGLFATLLYKLVSG